jgi:hypothetical protein
VSGWWTRPALYGLPLRLLLMPLGACWDLFGYYWISHQWVYHGVLPLGHHSGTLLVWPIFYLHAGWLWLIRPLLGGDLWGEGLRPSASVDPFWITPETLQAFYLQPRIHVVLLLLKLPYVLAEVLLIAGVRRWGPRAASARRRLAWFLWLNPISLYAIALFGAWDVIPVGLIVASLMLLPRRPGWAGACLGLATISKSFPALLLPVFLLHLGGRRAALARFSAGVGFVVALWLAAGTAIGARMAFALFGLPYAGMAMTSQITLYFHDRLYLFLVAYVVFLFWCAHRGAARGEGLTRTILGALLLFFSLSFFHVHWLFWLVPFLGVRLAVQRELLWPFAVQALAAAVYSLQWDRVLTTYLVAAINPVVLMAAASPLERLAPWVSPGTLAGVGHSLFAGAALWMAYVVLKRTAAHA